MESQVVGVLGGGQLGRMLAQAASPMGIPCVFVDPDPSSPAKQVSSPSLFPFQPRLEHVTGAFTDPVAIRKLAAQVDILTYEIEHVDVDAVEAVASEFATTGGRSGEGIKIFPAPRVIRTIQDKYAQKVYLAARGVPVAPFVQITATPAAAPGSDNKDPRATLIPSILKAGAEFGYPLMLKSRHLAYDGKGNHVLRSSDDAAIEEALSALIPTASLSTGKPIADRLYAEKFAPFVKEVAVMVVRGVSGETRTYPAVETIHRDNICHIVYAPVRPPITDESGIGRKQKGLEAVTGQDLNDKARAEAERAIDALGEGAVGVFGVEMFLMADGSLLLNEIAPRPHNSGHYTIEACQPSQYTSHLFAILSRPLPPISFIPASAAMLNLLGATSSTEDDFLTPEGVVEKAFSMGGAVHLYGKGASRKGRKMGHITVLGTSDAEVRSKISALVATLPEMYRDKPSPLSTSSSLRSLLPNTKSKGVAPDGPFSSPTPLVSIIMGSDSDLPTMLPATNILSSFKIPYELSIVSAHRTPARMVQFARTAAGRGLRVIIAGAGGAAHLPGMVASETSLPVVGVPVKGSSLDGVDSLYSIVQMPKGIPVATMAINNSTNAALLAVRILASSGHSPDLRDQIDKYAENLEDEVLAKIARLEDGGWADYVVKK